MTTPPEARLYRLSREESVLSRSRGEGPATHSSDTAAGRNNAAGSVGNETPARDRRSDPKVDSPRDEAAKRDGRQVRVEVRRRASEASRDGGTGLGAASGGAGVARGGPDHGRAAIHDMSAGARPNAPQAGDAHPDDAGHDDMARLLQIDETDDGFPDMRAAQAEATSARSGDADDLAAAIAAVRAERLSPRQLRVAMRLATANGVEAESDEEAVVRLRMKGIDPLERSGLKKVVADAGARASARPASNAPSVVPEPGDKGRAVKLLGGLPAKQGRELAPAGTPAQLPPREAMTEERRAAEIRRIQMDIARRRRRRMAMLFFRLAAFVFLPTLVAGWYYATQATPLYATESQFQIQKSEGASSGPLGGLLAGTQLATNPDSVAVQSYLGSRDAMLRLDEELGFKRVFQDPSIDPLLRLPTDATSEQAYGIYSDVVKISYDPTEGVIGMEVAAPDPQLSEQYSRALIRYAEGQIDQMTARLREDQMTGAIASYADAERKVDEAQQRIQDLQQKLGVLDPASEGASAMAQISTLETELIKKQLELGQLQANARPNASRVEGVQGDVDRLQQMITERRAQLTQSSATRDSLAAVTGELRIAEGDLLTRQQLLAAAAAQVEAARIEANKQVRYLSLSISPVPPDEPTYPKVVQNTIISFLIFAGIYLMLSLTASILREQVSS